MKSIFASEIMIKLGKTSIISQQWMVDVTDTTAWYCC